MTNTHRIAVGTMITLIGVSLVYAFIMCGEIGVADAWMCIRNDPGKFIFHILFLPASFGALIWSVPTSLVRRCVGRNRMRQSLVVGTGIALAALGVFVGVSQAIQGFDERSPVPTDVRAAIVGVDGQARQARAPLLAAWQKYHNARWSPTSPNDGAPFSVERELGFNSALAAALGEKRNFWSQASVGAWWSALLSVMGVWLICGWTLLVIVVVLERGALEEPQIARLTVAFCTGLASLGVWFYLKMYSEWYIHFYSVPTISLSPLIMTVLAVVALTAAALFAKHARRPLTWFAALSAISGVITGATAYWKPEILRAVADAYRQADDSAVIGLWILLGLVAFSAAYLIGSDPEESGSSPTASNSMGHTK